MQPLQRSKQKVNFQNKDNKKQMLKLGRKLYGLKMTHLIQNKNRSKGGKQRNKALLNSTQNKEILLLLIGLTTLICT